MNVLDLSTLGLSEEQRALRRGCIGGSDALAIVSGDWQKLWAVKTGRIPDDDLSDILPVVMGQFTEPLNCAWYTKKTGRPVHRIGEHVRHPIFPYLGVTLDGLTQTAEGFPADIQFKHVGQDSEATEVRYTAQCHHEAACLGVNHYLMSMFVGNSKWVLHERECDPFFTEEYLAKAAQFWRFVEADIEPPPAPPLPVPPPRRLRTLDMTGSNEWASFAVEWLRMRGPAKAFEDAAKGLKKMVEIDVGLAVGHGVQIKRGKNDALYISEVKE